MSDIKEIGSYQAVALGFEDVLANCAEAKQQANRDAFKLFATSQDVFDSRFMNIAESVHNAAKAQNLGEAETIAWTLAQACIIDDEADIEDTYVTGVLACKQQAYNDVENRGLPEIGGMSLLVRALDRQLSKRVGIVSVAPVGVIKAFLRHSTLDDIISCSHIFAADDEDETCAAPNPEQYINAGNQLKIDSPEGLLVIDSSPEALIAAKKAGATVVGILNGQPRTTWETLEAHQFAPDFIDTNHLELSRQLGIPAPRASKLP
jgi:beta-phosphoglucomutase-like phosphatase (HAD superfamily)